MKIKVKNLFLILGLLAGNLLAQINPSEIIENSLQAIGGKKEIAKISSLQAFADCTGPNGNYATEIYSAKNSRLIFKQVRANGNIYLGQTNGQIFWTKNEKSGEFSLADQKEAAIWRSHDFQRLVMEVSSRFGDLIYVGEEDFAGRTSIKLRGKDELGKTSDLFFDKETKLMSGFTIQNPFNAQPETIRIVFNEWKRIGGLKLPSKITATDKQGDFVLNFREIVFNKTDEKIFALPPKVAAMNELFQLQKQARVAHFTRNANLLVSTFAEDFTSIAGGKISRPTREESLNRFQNYLNNSTFIEWDDIAPPIIRVSDDTTLGYVLVYKKVRLSAKDAQGKEQEETEIFAWIETYRKIKGEWKLTAVVSTNTPENDGK